MERIGELAAFAAAICWTLSAVFFEQGIKRLGVLTVNFYKVLIAFVLLTITATLSRGMPLPLDAPKNTVIFLSLSGLVGFVIADNFLLSAYSTVGPRVAMLFMALSPFMTGGIAYIFLGEKIGPKGLFGMVLVIAGIIITVFGKNGFAIFKIAREDRRGYIFAFCSSLGQSVGMSLTKIGVAGYNPVSGTQIRTFTAIVGFGLISLFLHRGQNIRKAMKNPASLKYIAIGSVFGSFIGVVLILFAMQSTSAGIVSTLIGLTPVLILVPDIFVLKKKVKALEIAGAIIAVCGTVVFFL